MKIFFTISCSGKSTLIKNTNNEKYIFFENVIGGIVRVDKDFLLDFLNKYKDYPKEIIFLENSLILDNSLMKEISNLAEVYFITFTKEQYDEIFKRKEIRNTKRLSYKEDDYNVRKAFKPSFCSIIEYKNNLIDTVNPYL